MLRQLTRTNQFRAPLIELLQEHLLVFIQVRRSSQQQPGEGTRAGQHRVGRRWRLDGAPPFDLASDGALAATIALLPHFVEQKGRDLLALSPPPRQIRKVRVEGGSPTTTGTEEVGGNFSIGKASDGLAVQPDTPGDGADGQSVRHQLVDLSMPLRVPRRKPTWRKRGRGCRRR